MESTICLLTEWTLKAGRHLKRAAFFQKKNRRELTQKKNYSSTASQLISKKGLPLRPAVRMVVSAGRLFL